MLCKCETRSSKSEINVSSYGLSTVPREGAEQFRSGLRIKIEPQGQRHTCGGWCHLQPIRNTPWLTSDRLDRCPESVPPWDRFFPCYICGASPPDPRARR